MKRDAPAIADATVPPPDVGLHSFAVRIAFAWTIVLAALLYFEVREMKQPISDRAQPHLATIQSHARFTAGSYAAVWLLGLAGLGLVTRRLRHGLLQQQLIERTLRETEARQRALITYITDVIAVVDPHTTTRYISPNIERWFGWTPAETLNTRAWDRIHPDDLPRASEHLQTILADSNASGTLTCRYRCKNGSYRWIESSCINLLHNPDVNGILINYHDITERRQSEEALRVMAESGVSANEDIFRFLVRQLAQSQHTRFAFIARINESDPTQAHTLAVWAYEGFAANFSYRLENTPCSNVLQQGLCLHPRNVQHLFPNDRLLKEMGAESYCGMPLHGADGRAVGIIVVLHDQPLESSPHTLSMMQSFAARATAELARLNSEEKYQTLFREMLGGLAVHEIITDPQGKPVDYRYLAVNPAFERMTGLQASRVLGRTVSSVLPNIEPFWIEIFGRVALTGQSAHFENYTKALDRHFEVTAYQVGRGRFACIFSDISERKKAEQASQKLQEQLIQAQKMESVGRLAGGVAHDFNNMLGVIVGHADLALEQTSSTHPLRPDLEEIRKAAQRSANLTRQLLAFARKQTIAPEILDLNETVEGMLKMLRRLIGENIELAWKPAPSLRRIRIDPSQVDQLLANLCVNARDAIGSVGLLTIETRDLTITPPSQPGPDDPPPGPYVRLTVTDNGCGMDASTLAHIFEPFFTTKKAGEGTGLGLATVFGIVKQNSGFITVHSQPGQGTTFTISLPAHLGASPRDHTPTPQPAQGGSETILLVEDEPAVLALARTLLDRLGYIVLTAASPAEALRLSQSHTGNIHLLLSDLVMPGMNGRDLAAQLTTHRPNLRFLFMSGYPANLVTHSSILDQGVPFIQKPFSRLDLASKVREALRT